MARPKPKPEVLASEVEGVGLRDRRRMARSVLWLHLGMKCEEWSGMVTGALTHDDDGFQLAPFDDWPDNDPLKRLCVVLDLTPAQLAAVLHDLGGRCEAKAEAAGYADVPDGALG